MPAAMQPEASIDERRSLLAAARELYEQDGFAATGPAAILDRAGLDPFALCRQFSSAEELFSEVYIEVQQELAAEVRVRACSSQDPVGRLRLACTAVLDAAADARRAQVVFVDAPSTLGTERCRELARARSPAVVRETVRDVVELSSPGARDDTPLAELIVVVLDLAARAIARSPDPAARTEIGRTVETWLDELVASLHAQAER